MLLTNKSPHFEFICVTMPGLEPPLEESGYRPENALFVRSFSYMCIELTVTGWWIVVT